MVVSPGPPPFAITSSWFVGEVVVMEGTTTWRGVEREKEKKKGKYTLHKVRAIDKDNADCFS